LNRYWFQFKPGSLESISSEARNSLVAFSAGWQSWQAVQGESGCHICKGPAQPVLKPPKPAIGSTLLHPQSQPPWHMCLTQSGEPLPCDYLTTASGHYLNTTGLDSARPHILVSFGPETQVSTQPTLERAHDLSNAQLGMLMLNFNSSADMPQP
jgi:hypothetical protein